MTAPESHWSRVWRDRAPDEVSWYQATPARSRALIERVAPGRGAAVVDVGGGASRLVDELLADGYHDVTVLDIADEALARARTRLGAAAASVTWIRADVTAWSPPRIYDVWHDRAVLHFLVDDADRRRYVEALGAGTAPGGHAVLATFGPDGPTSCSGLPVRRSSADDLAALAGDAFSLVDAVEEVHRTPTGTEQQFVYAVLARTVDAPRS